MSFFDRLRNLLSGPPHVADGGDPEAAAALREEYGTPDAGEEEAKRIALTGQVASTDEALYGVGGTGSGIGAAEAGFGASEAAEAAEEDLESEEAPPDPAP